MLEDSSFIMRLIGTLIDLYSLVILVAVIMSWFPVNRRSLLWTTVRGLTEPVRRVLPPMGGLDLSPMVLLIGLQFLRRLFW
jgi:YggT family protein